MVAVQLTVQEWNQVLTIIGDAPWRVANPLLMKIGGQLRAHESNIEQGVTSPQGDGASKEASHE